MDLVETLKINMRVIALIASKYAVESDLLNHSGPEARYYKQLKNEVDKVRLALNNGGIGQKVDDGQSI